MEFLKSENPLEFEKNIDIRFSSPTKLRGLTNEEFVKQIFNTILKEYFENATSNNGNKSILKTDFVALKFINSKTNDLAPIIYPSNVTIKKSVDFRENYEKDINVSKLIFSENAEGINNSFFSLSLKNFPDEEKIKNLNYLFIKNSSKVQKAYKKYPNNNDFNINWKIEKLKNKFSESIDDLIGKSVDENAVENFTKIFLQKLLIEKNKIIIFKSTSIKFFEQIKPLGLIVQFSFNENEYNKINDEEKLNLLRRILLYSNRVFSICERYYLNQLTVEFDEAHIKSAIQSILIDSYAHNVSAHSLNFLQHLFSYRTEHYLKQFFPLQSFSRLENLPLNKITYTDFFRANNLNCVKNQWNSIKDPEEQKLFKDQQYNLSYYEAIGQSDSTNTLFNANLLDYILYGTDQFNGIDSVNLLKYKGNGTHNKAKLPMPIDYAVAPLITYLRDKGAFWSGIIRDNKATPSQIVSLYDVLMEMCSNPLFIGSIMAAENIFIIHFFINTKNPVENEKYNEINGKPTHFLTINIKEFVETEMNLRDEESKLNEKYANELLDIRHSSMSFIRLTKKHHLLREILQNQSILLPGGLVGKHALFTIIENTLRNAKHLKLDHRPLIQQNGLELHLYIRDEKYAIEKTIIDFVMSHKKRECERKLEINLADKNIRKIINEGKKECVKSIIKTSLEESSLEICNEQIDNLTEQLFDKELFRVGIHLDYVKKESSVDINTSEIKTNGGGKHEENLVQSVVKSSYRPILSYDGKPNMGGSSQDKICAAALFNGFFSSVEYPMDEVKNHYPWIAYNILPDSVPDELHKHSVYGKFRKMKKEDIRDEFSKSDSEYYKEKDKNLEAATFEKDLYVKFFHIWKGQDIMFFDNEVTDDNKSFIYSIPRFKIAIVSCNKSFEPLRKKAILRIVDENEFKLETDPLKRKDQFVKEYYKWNKKWLGENVNEILFEKNLNYRKIDFDENEIKLSEIDSPNVSQKGQAIPIDHDEGALKGYVCKLRTHGYFLNHFIGRNLTELFKGTVNNQDKALKQELFESIFTQITIFENRLFKLIDNYKFEGQEIKKHVGILKDKLNLIIHSEELDLVDLKNNNYIKSKRHFYIFHLSYVESIIKSNSSIFKDKEKEVEMFIQEVFGIKEESDAPDNFIVCMTTGRGRDEWLYKAGRFRKNCIHIPIESLQTAIQQGVLFKDDFDIKYNLCKVLFGS